MSSLVGGRVDRHDGFVDAFFGGKMSKGFILCDILAHAPGLMVEFGIAAGGTCVPDGNIVATRETVVEVVEMFVVVGWRIVAKGCGSRGCWYSRNAGREGKSISHGWWLGCAVVSTVVVFFLELFWCVLAGAMIANCCVMAASCCVSAENSCCVD